MCMLGYLIFVTQGTSTHKLEGTKGDKEVTNYHDKGLLNFMQNTYTQKMEPYQIQL